MAPPWRLYVQRETDGPWARKDFETYRDTFRRLKAEMFEGIHDATIQSKGHAFDPPYRIVKVVRNGQPVLVKGIQETRVMVWKPTLPEGETPHRWCPYCRRPTIFSWFSNHHAFPKNGVVKFDPTLLRCTICGVSDRLVDSR